MLREFQNSLALFAFLGCGGIFQGILEFIEIASVALLPRNDGILEFFTMRSPDQVGMTQGLGILVLEFQITYLLRKVAQRLGSAKIFELGLGLVVLRALNADLTRSLLACERHYE